MFAVILNCMLRKQHLVLFSLSFIMKKKYTYNLLKSFSEVEEEEKIYEKKTSKSHK